MGRFDEIQRLFDEARVLDPDAREVFLSDIEDGGLRAEVSVLLESDATVDDTEFMEVRPDAQSQALPEPGSEFGHYLILRELGRGGSGVVFLARDRDQDREVALKLLHPLLWTSEESRGQLKDEADMAAEIERFHRGERDGRWRIREDAVRELLPVLEAMSFAHEQGIWHRDIKPSNVLLKDGSHAYLGDFGLVLFEALSGEHAFASNAGEAELLERTAHGEARLLHEAWPGASLPDPLSRRRLCTYFRRFLTASERGGTAEVHGSIAAATD